MLRSRAYEPIRRCHKDLEYVSSCSIGVEVQRGQHAGFTVLLLFVIFRFYEAVCEYQQEVTG